MDMKIILSRDVSEECLKELKERERQCCFMSADNQYWLISDMTYCEYLSNKYGAITDFCLYDLEEYPLLKYEGETFEWKSESFEWIGEQPSLREQAEAAIDVFKEMANEGSVNLNDWDAEIDAYAKTAIMANVSEEMKDSLKSLLYEGYNIALIREVIESVLDDAGCLNNKKA